MVEDIIVGDLYDDFAKKLWEVEARCPKKMEIPKLDMI